MTTMEILKRTKAAWPSICNASAEDKNRILSAMADSLQAGSDTILRCNAEDMDAARGHISDVMLDRLYLDRGRIDAMADGMPRDRGAAGPHGAHPRADRPSQRHEDLQKACAARHVRHHL